MEKKIYFPIKQWGIVFLMVLLHASSSLPIKANQDSYRKGDFLKPQLGKMIIAKGMDEKIQKAELTILLFFDPLKTLHKTNVCYANLLQQKYARKGLRIIGIPVKSGEPVGNLPEISGSIEIISDGASDIYPEFGFQACCGGTVFLDKKGKIIFFEKRLVDEDVLRQLTEKYLLGKIRYILNMPQKRILFEANSRFPSLKFRREGDNTKIKTSNLVKNRTILTFFSSMCSSCRTGGRVDTLKKIEKILDEQKINTTFYLVFFPPFDENDVKFWEQKIELPFNRVFCYSNIYTDEERYIADNSMRLDPLTVVIDDNLDIIFIEQFGMSEEGLIEDIKKIKVQSK